MAIMLNRNIEDSTLSILKCSVCLKPQSLHSARCGLWYLYNKDGFESMFSQKKH